MKPIALSLLDEIRADKALDGRKLAPPATEEELAALQTAATEQLGYTLPATYRELLTHCNGLDHNGTVIYATSDVLRTKPSGRVTYDRMGLVEANLLWRDYEPHKEFVFLAETGDVLYRHNLVSGKFEVVDRVAGDMDDPATDAYDTLDPLLERLFHKMLNHFDLADE